MKGGLGFLIQLVIQGPGLMEALLFLTTVFKVTLGSYLHSSQLKCDKKRNGELCGTA